MKKYIVTIIIALIIMIPSVHAMDYGYEIKAYDIDMVVNEDNTFDITETITANFKESRHGIYRKIPMRNTIERLDGTKSKNAAKISNVSVDTTYTKSRTGNYMVLKIGNANYTITGEKTYVIKYTYDIGNDPLKDKDELYFNLIGTEWDTTIKNITFKITMPDDFDESELGFSAGREGSSDSSNVIYSVDDNVITGEYIGYLDENEGLTVRLELEDGYFIKRFFLSKRDIIILGIIIVLTAIAIIIRNKYGYHDYPIETVEFYPPEGMNSVELALVGKTKIDNSDVTSLLIYLANKGYLKITEDEDKKKAFTITKIKEYDGNNEDERLFLNGLFEKSNSVSKMDLYNKFYITVNKIIKNNNKKESRYRILEKDSLKMSKIIKVFIAIVSILMILSPSLDFGSNIFNYGMFVIISVLLICNSIAVDKKNIIGKTKVGIIAIIVYLMFLIIPIFSILPLMLIYKNYLLIFLTSLVSLYILAYCNNRLNKRTEYGFNNLGKIIGFKEFLETAEKENLETMVEKNPTYFYDILPYTYVLNVSNKWIKKFESITMEPPSWYSGTSDFNMVTFSSFMDSTVSSATSAMTSSPSSSSGGGSSGGGSGGGGGGSW